MQGFWILAFPTPFWRFLNYTATQGGRLGHKSLPSGFTVPYCMFI